MTERLIECKIKNKRSGKVKTKDNQRLQSKFLITWRRTWNEIQIRLAGGSIKEMIKEEEEGKKKHLCHVTVPEGGGGNKRYKVMSNQSMDKDWNQKM